MLEVNPGLIIWTIVTFVILLVVLRVAIEWGLFQPAEVVGREDPVRRVGVEDHAALRLVGSIQLEGHRGEYRSKSIVQVASKPPPLFFAGRYQPLTGTLQIQRQAHVVGGYTCLPGDSFQQPSVAL